MPVEFDARVDEVSRRVARALLRAVLAPRLPHARDGVRADGGDDRQGLRDRLGTVEGVHALAAELREAGRVRRAAPAGCAARRCARAIVGLSFSPRPRHARYVPLGREHGGGDLFGGATRRPRRGGRAGRARGAQGLLEDPSIAQGRPRPEVRCDRARAPRRRRSAGSRPTRCSPATCSMRRGRRTRSRIWRSSTPATRRCVRRTSAAAAPRRSRSRRSRPRARSTSRASARTSRCSSSGTLRALLRTEDLETVYRDLELPLVPGARRDRARRRPRGRRRARRAVAARRSGAGDAQRADLRAGRRGVQHQLAAAARRRSCSTSCSCPALKRNGKTKTASTAVRGARGAGARARPAAPDPRMARAAEAEGHLHRRAAAARQPETRAACTPASTRRWPRRGA